MMACQMFLARDWYTFAAFDSSLLIYSSAIFSLALTRSYTYLVSSRQSLIGLFDFVRPSVGSIVGIAPHLGTPL